MKVVFPRSTSAVFVFLLALPQSLFAAPFPDMENEWYRHADAVAGLTERGVIGGYPDGTFKPGKAINRAELLKIVFQGRHVAAVERRCFSDVNPDEWYAPYVCAAQRRGIIAGYPDGTYKPDRTVNYAEAIKIILRAYGREFSEPSGDAWYEPYISELDRKDILSRSAYVPWDDLSRVHAADLLWRVLRHDEDGVILRYSEGCGRAPPAGPNVIDVEGRSRDFLLTVPSAYVIHDPVPLIIAFHGRTNDNGEVRSYYRLDREVPEAIIVYPAALSNGNGTFSWSDAGDDPHTLRDIAFFDALVKQIASRYCIDMDRVFTVGHSLGGWFANSVACVRGDVVRGSVSVGGDSVITDCSGPSAAMIIHNPDDRLAPFAGSQRNREMRTETNACNWELRAADPSSLSCSAHGGCLENPVTFCPHEKDIDGRGEYYPHNWPRETAGAIRDFIAALR